MLQARPLGDANDRIAFLRRLKAPEGIEEALRLLADDSPDDFEYGVWMHDAEEPQAFVSREAAIALARLGYAPTPEAACSLAAARGFTVGTRAK